MADLTWEWLLPSGEAMIARLDPSTKVESVFVGQRLVSRSGVGGKPEGHTVPLLRAPGAGPYRGPTEAYVAFDSRRSSCVARIDAKELPPIRSPYMGQQEPELPPSRPSSGIAKLAVVVGAVCVVAAIGAFVAIRHLRDVREQALAREATISETFRSPNGLLVAHHSPAFIASPQPNTPPGTSVVALRHRTKDEGLFLASFILPFAAPTDVWRIHQLIHKDFLAGLGPDAASYVEQDRQDGKCAGEDGAIVFGRIQVKGHSGKLWVCTFLHGGHPYRFMYAAADAHVAMDEALLRRIVDATELTALPDLTGGTATPFPVPMGTSGR